MKSGTTIAGAALFGLMLGMAGCSTEPAGGKLPEKPPEVSAEKAKQDFTKVQNDMYSKMGAQGNAGTKAPDQLPGAAP